jgi:hypothetical protein
MARAVLPALATICVCALSPPLASAVSERAVLHASFHPDRLGAPTTISFAFDLATVEGLAPPPLSTVDLRLPAGLNYTTTTLGLALCQPAMLLARGVAGCPSNSRLGSGSALVEVPFGAGTGHEIPEIQAVAGPSPAGNMVVLFYANGLFPVYAQLTFVGELLADTAPFGSQLLTRVPLVASVPGGPDVSIVHVQASIGPHELTYYRHAHGHLVPFTPRGVAVPAHCPRHGFPFAASFTFQDGTSTTAQTTVPCPPPPRHHHHRRPHG